MILHIVAKESPDDTLCGEETCRLALSGFLWLDGFKKKGWESLPKDWIECGKCEEKVIRNRCPECRTVLETKVNETLKLTARSHDVEIPCVSWQECPKCKERVFSSKLTQLIFDTVWGIEDANEVKRLSSLIYPDCINGHDWPKDYRIIGFVLQRNCKVCYMVERK